MRQIKTQNIPLESFAPVQEKKVEPKKSGEEFSIIFNASYNEQLETEDLKVRENLEEVEDLEKSENLTDTENFEDKEDEEIQGNNLEISWLLESTSIEENVALEGFSKENSFIDSLREYPMSEIATDSFELEVTEDINKEINTISGNVTKEQFIGLIKEDVDKPSDYESLQNLQTSDVLSNLTSLDKKHTMNTNSEVDSKSLDLNKIIEEKSDKTRYLLTEDIPTEIDIDKIFDPKKIVETIDFLEKQPEENRILEIEDNNIRNFTMNEDIEETNHEVKETELVNPTFERSIEQLRMLRMIEPQTKEQEIVKIPEAEWVNQMESIITEEVHLVNEPNRVSKTKIQLTPEHLGKMDIELVLKEKGLTARLVVEHAETKGWLEQKLGELTVRLAAQNIEVTDFQISITENSQNLLDAGMQGNSFTKEQKNSENQKKGVKYSSKKESAVEIIEKKNDLNTGRLSMWV